MDEDEFRKILITAKRQKHDGGLHKCHRCQASGPAPFVVDEKLLCYECFRQMHFAQASFGATNRW